MGSALSSLSYDDVRAIMDRALANGRGILVSCDTIGQAHHLRQRCYEWRMNNRKANKETYPPENPMHNRSAYDRLIFSPVEHEGAPHLQIVVASAERLEERIVEL